MKTFFSKMLTIILAVSFVCFCFSGCGKSENNEIKNIIIIIGDGCGLEHIEAGELYEGKDYAFTNWHSTTVNTDSVDEAGNLVLTDSAAGATAIASGTLTINMSVGVDPEEMELTTVMDVALQKGKATGVVTTDTIYGATPGAFSGHTANRNDKAGLVSSQFKTSNVNLLCASYASYVSSQQNMIEENGYTFLDNYDYILDTMDDDKVYWQFDMAGMEAEIPLEEVTEHAINYLEQDKDGFVLMIEQAHIDKYAHNGNFEGVLHSVMSLNKTVETVMEWIGDRKDTAVLITADHETGELFVGAESMAISANTHNTLSGDEIYYYFFTNDHTKTPVGLFTYGIKPDFSKFSQFSSDSMIKNIETNKIIMTLLDNPTAY